MQADTCTYITKYANRQTDRRTYVCSEHRVQTNLAFGSKLRGTQSVMDPIPVQNLVA